MYPEGTNLFLVGLVFVCVGVRTCACVCVRECVGVRTSVCVCLCVCEREKET